jgi:exopolysaccharide biosynthesis polyprenyl glycosylphosphotransferase
MRESIARYRRTLFVGGLLAADALVIALSIFASDWVRFHLLPGAPIDHLPHDLLVQPALLAVVVFLPMLSAVGLYEMRRGWSVLDVGFSTLVASVLGVLGFLGLSYLFKAFFYSRLMVWIFGGVVCLGLSGLRLLCKRALLFGFRRGLGVLRMVIIGDSPIARSLVARIQANPHSGLRIVGQLLASGNGGNGEGVEGSRLPGAFEALKRAQPHICLFAEPIHGREEMIALLARCQEEALRVWLATELHERYSPTMELKEVESIPLIVVGSLRLARWERLLKRLIDMTASASLLIVSAPFLLFAALRARREIGGPFVFRQPRVGFQGRSFSVLKVRAVGEDPSSRTPFCDFLRAYSLDELLQLWNVLKGEMSLVGPRPETLDRVRHYNPWNRRRLQVKPGITGLAQVAGVRGEHDFDTKSRYDVLYLENQSLLLDLKILLKTPLAVLRRRFGAGGSAPGLAAVEAGAAPPLVGAGIPTASEVASIPRVGRYRPPGSARARDRQKGGPMPW